MAPLFTVWYGLDSILFVFFAFPLGPSPYQVLRSWNYFRFHLRLGSERAEVVHKEMT